MQLVGRDGTVPPQREPEDLSPDCNPVENRPVPIVIAIAVGVFGVHAAVASGGGYLNYVSGIWLALANDLQHGVFYRELMTEGGYGGTRYFPLFFVVIGAFMRLGASPLAAGCLASALTAIVLTSGMYALVRGLGGTRPIAGLFAACAISSYFIQQTLFEVRADVLAAALNVWGLAFLLRGWEPAAGRRPRPTLSALCFTLALAAKVTSLAVPIAAAAGLLVAGRQRLATAVSWRLMAGGAVFLALVYWTSDGRAIESWRACMFAGSDAGGTFGSVLDGYFLRMTRYSHLLKALLAMAVGAIAFAIWRASRDRDAGGWRSAGFIATLFVGATGSTALLLSSPGTVPSNQMVEWVLMVLVVLAFLAFVQPRLGRAVVVAVSVLTLWASWQNVSRLRQTWETRPTAAQASERERLLARVAAAPGPVLAESPLWPLVASREVYMLDPFALRVVMQSRKDIEGDLSARVERRMFPMVILQLDPATAIGQSYYPNVNFGWPLMEKILANYRIESHPLDDVYIYVPR